MRSSTIAVGLVASLSALLLTPSATYKAQTLVASADPASPFAAVSIRAAAGRVRSKPVLAQAALSLNETGRSAPHPSLVDRLALVFGFGDARSTDAVQRLAADLGGRAAAHAGEIPGTLQVTVADSVADEAARAADALAQALVKAAADDAVQAARLRERDATNRLEAMRGRAIAARRRLADLGGADADPAQIRSQIAAQVSALQARVDAIRNVVASGNPPLADRRDMPPTIEALQSSYLDLTRQLAKARETLGDRHTTIISLQDEVRHASAALSTEWRRLMRLAEADLKSAKTRQSALPDANAPAVIARRDALADARREVEIADAAFVRAQTERSAAASDDLALRVVAPAAVPTATTGWPWWARGLAAGLAGLLGAAAVLLARMPAGRRPEAATAPVTDPVRLVPDASTTRRSPPSMDETMKQRPHADSHRDRLLGWAEKRLERAMERLIPKLDGLGAAFGGVPTIVVATDDPSLRTTTVSLAFARAAAADGRRVLLVEPAARDTTIAAMADVEAEPVVLDFFGTLRVALAAEGCDGPLFLAPAFIEGDDIAAALVRNGTAESVDELAEAFDLIVIDGGDAEELAAEGWGGDAFLRVGADASVRDDRRLTDFFDAPAQALLGTVVGGRLHEDDASPETHAASAMRDAASAMRPSAPRGTSGRPRLVSTAYGRPVAAPAQRARR